MFFKCQQPEYFGFHLSLLQLEFCDAFLWLKIYISVTFHSKYMIQKHHKHHFLSPFAFIHCFPPILYLNITYVKVILYICCVIWIHISNFGHSNSRMLNCNQKIIMWVFIVAVQVITSSWPYYSIWTSEFCIVWLQGEFYLQC
jgi:hypothetical protein